MVQPQSAGDESWGGRDNHHSHKRVRVITSPGHDSMIVTGIVSMLEVVARSRCRCIILDGTEAGD